MTNPAFPIHRKDKSTLLNWAPLLSRLTSKEDILVDAVDYRTYTPSFSASGAMTWTGVTTYEGFYVLLPPFVFVRVNASGTTGGVANNTLYCSLPIPCPRIFTQGYGLVSDGAGANIAAMVQTDAIERLTIRRYDNANFGLGADRLINITTIYLLE